MSHDVPLSNDALDAMKAGVSELPPSHTRPTGMTRQEFRRLARESKRQITIPTIHLVDCPNCNKHRHTKYANENGEVSQPSQDTVVVRGETRFVDVCQHCTLKYRRRDERFVMENLKKLQRAAMNRDGNTTDKDFSIDV